MFAEHQMIWTDEKVSRLWDYYSRTVLHYFSDLHGRELLTESGLSLNRPLKVLDFGCGPGFIWDHLQRLGSDWRYTGLDFSQASVDKLNDKAAGAPNFEGAYKVEALPTSLPAGNYDVVTLFEVVEHLNDEHLHGTLSEVARLLKPGGQLIVSTPNEERLEDTHKFCANCGAIFHEWQHVRSWSRETLGDHLLGYGLRAERMIVTDLSAVGPIRKAAYLAKKSLKKSYKPPHMLAVFRKV